MWHIIVPWAMLGPLLLYVSNILKRCCSITYIFVSNTTSMDTKLSKYHHLYELCRAVVQQDFDWSCLFGNAIKRQT